MIRFLRVVTASTPNLFFPVAFNWGSFSGLFSRKAWRRAPLLKKSLLLPLPRGAVPALPPIAAEPCELRARPGAAAGAGLRRVPPSVRQGRADRRPLRYPLQRPQPRSRRRHVPVQGRLAGAGRSSEPGALGRRPPHAARYVPGAGRGRRGTREGRGRRAGSGAAGGGCLSERRSRRREGMPRTHRRSRSPAGPVPR